jgi:hypothetical protein
MVLSKVTREPCCTPAALLIDDKAVSILDELERSELEDVLKVVIELETETNSDTIDVEELAMVVVVEDTELVVELILDEEVLSAPREDEREDRLPDALDSRSSTLEEEREYTAEMLLCEVIALLTELMELLRELLLDERALMVELSLVIPALSETILAERLERLESPGTTPEFIDKAMEPFADSIELLADD